MCVVVDACCVWGFFVFVVFFVCSLCGVSGWSWVVVWVLVGRVVALGWRFGHDYGVWLRLGLVGFWFGCGLVVGVVGCSFCMVACGVGI